MRGLPEDPRDPLDGVVGGARAQAGYVDIVRGHEVSRCENRMQKMKG